MAVKAELETLDGLPEPLIKEYKQVDRAGKKVFVLDLEGFEACEDFAGPLKRARDHEKTHRTEAEKRLQKAKDDHKIAMEAVQAELDGIRTGAVPKADVDAYKKSVEERQTKMQKEFSDKYDGEIAKRDRALRRVLVENEAVKLASKIFTVPDLAIPVIEKRLGIEEVDGVYQTRVLGSDGKPSAFTIEDLEKEMKADKRFAQVIIGSHASGGGANGAGAGGGGGGGGGKDWSKVNPNNLRGKEIVEYTKWRQEQRKNT